MLGGTFFVLFPALRVPGLLLDHKFSVKMSSPALSSGGCGP